MINNLTVYGSASMVPSISTKVNSLCDFLISY